MDIEFDACYSHPLFRGFLTSLFMKYILHSEPIIALSLTEKVICFLPPTPVIPGRWDFVLYLLLKSFIAPFGPHFYWGSIENSHLNGVLSFAPAKKAKTSPWWT